MNKTIIATLLIISILIISCAPQATPRETMDKKGVSAGGDDATVRIKGSKFTPNDLHVKTGSKVTWRNEDPVPHNVLSDDGALASPDLEQGDSWTYTFTEPGTFSYVCSLHSGMKGSVVVE